MGLRGPGGTAQMGHQQHSSWVFWQDTLSTVQTGPEVPC